MKKKQTIQILRTFNEWRKDPDATYADQPSTKLLGHAIDNAIATLEAKGGYVDYQETEKEWNDSWRYYDIFGGCKTSTQDEYTMGAIEMLLMISKDMGWEESETFYYKKFFEKDLSEMKI